MKDAEKREVVQLLQDLIRYDTTNPPGNETPAAEHLKTIFDHENIPCEIVESQPGRGSFLAQLNGTSTKPTLLLLSHLDVVPATQPDKWKHPPFSGTLDNNWIYGRGAIDTKYLTAAEAMTLILLKRSGTKLNKTLKLAAVADEERGGTQGAGHLVKNHPDKLQADYIINEGGGLVLKTRKKPVYLLEAEEKGLCWIKLTTRGKAAHASIPDLGQSAVAKMAQALAKIAQHKTKPKPSPTLKKMLQTLAKLETGPNATLFKKLLTKPQQSEQILNTLRKKEPQMAATLNALFRMSISQTMIKGGVKENVIPDHCEAVLDCRLPQGLTEKDAINELRKATGNMDGLEFETIQYHPASTSPTDNQFYRTIEKHLKTIIPNAEVSPFVVTGATDSRYLRPQGAIAYGFAPTSPDIDYRQLIPLVHGINERINVESLYTCTDFLVSICKDMLS